MTSQYDSFSEIYDIWAATAPAARQNLPFYVQRYVQTPGLVVEMGVGVGRIALEAAKKGKAITGVDSSPGMLRILSQRAMEQGISDLVTIVEADMREFSLVNPAELITIPYNGVGHLLTEDDRAAAFGCIYNALAPGGRLIFDHHAFDPEHGKVPSHNVSLRASFQDATGCHYLWFYYAPQMDRQVHNLTTWEDTMAADGSLVRRKYRTLTSGWMTTTQAKADLENAGFVIEGLYGDFDESPFTDDSKQHVWFARK